MQNHFKVHDTNTTFVVPCVCVCVYTRVHAEVCLCVTHLHHFCLQFVISRKDLDLQNQIVPIYTLYL